MEDIVHYSSIRALLRRLAIGHFLITVTLYGMVFMFRESPFEWSDPLVWLLIVAQIPFVVLLIDAFGVIYYLRKVKQVVSVQELQETFLYGATWSYVKELVAMTNDFTKTVRAYEEKYPELLESRAYEEAIERFDLLAASVIVERVQRNRLRLESEATRRKEREDARQAELDEISAIARAEGIEEQPLREARQQGYAAVNALIARHRRRRFLLESADAFDSTPIVQAMLASKGDEVAYATFEKIRGLHRRAVKYDVEAAFREGLATGDLSAVESLIASAERKYTWQQKETELRERLQGMSDPPRSQLDQAITSLGELEYGSRRFRKELYEIERALNS